MNRTLRAHALAVLSLAAIAGTAAAQSNTQSHAQSPHNASELRAGMRKLWEDHITWTRVFIISAAAGLPDQEAATERLLRNQTDIGNAIKPFYGDAAGDQLTALLRGHITTAAELVTAAKANEQSAVRSASERWNANADSIAAFLSAANPRNWPERTLKSEMRRHLDLTTQEVTAHLQKKWEDDIEAYDKIHVQILQMADALAMGIAKQFPQKVVAER